MAVNSINDKLKSLIHTLKINPSDRVPTRSLINKEEYNPTKALDNLTKHLKQAQLKGAKVYNIEKDDFIVQRDPYTNRAKIQFEEAVRADGIVQRALIRKGDFVFAKGIRTVLDTMWDDFPPNQVKVDTNEEKKKPNITSPMMGAAVEVEKTKTDTTNPNQEVKVQQEFMPSTSIEDARSAAISAILSKQEYTNGKRQVDKVNKRCDFRFNLRAGYFNMKAYGRSALLIDSTSEDEEDDYPTSLYIMNSKLLGNVYCDKKTNKLAYIEYNTNDIDKYNNRSYYEPQDIIYFTNLDYHVSPNTLYYGLSEIEAVKDISETNRVLDEEDFKEWARSLWAGIILFTLPNLQNETELNNLMNEYSPGKPLAITSDVGAQVLRIADGLADGIDLHLQGDRRILRAFGMPSFTIGFEDVTNRATTQFILHAWKETFIEQERILIKDVVEKQWLNPLWAKALNMTIREVEELEAKLTLEFVEYNFDTFGQNVDAWLPLVQAGYISVEDFLEKIGEEELAQKYKQLKKDLVQKGFVPKVGQMQSPEQQGFGKKPGVPNDPTENQGGKGGGDDEGKSVSSNL